MLQWLLQTDFMPHGHCYYWRPDILWMHVVSDAVIALAYASIPVTLLLFVRKRRDLPFRWVFVVFAAFIVLCGATHVIGIWTVWEPVYALEGLVKAATAIVSILTAVGLIGLMPEALRLPSQEQLRSEVELRRAVEQRLESSLAELHRSNQRLEKFALVASDDLKSPLQEIIGLAGLLRGETQVLMSEQQRAYLTQIETAGWRMHKLINDQLSDSRVELPAQPTQAAAA